MFPAPPFRHQEVVARLHKALDAWVKRHGPGETAHAPVDMVLTTRRATRPDVVFISNELNTLPNAAAWFRNSTRPNCANLPRIDWLLIQR
jgi:hypothetical protein